VIRSFRHAGLERFFLKGSRAGIQPKHSRRLEEQLAVLNVARKPEQMNVPGWHLHSLKGKLEGHWSVRVSGNWRLMFRFEGEDAVLVDYRDYH
jgi:proteic killer suppression protein